MRQQGLHAKGWLFRFDRAARRGGLCDYDLRLITISGELTQRNEEAFFRDTILHEMAHALVGPGHAHDAVWKRKAREIGGTDKVCHDAVIVPRYVGTCPRCGALVSALRRSNCSCAKCSPGKFDREVVFQWRRASAAETSRVVSTTGPTQLLFTF
jgi:predicted SprT family Zn-dependent metalloprotease